MDCLKGEEDTFVFLYIDACDGNKLIDIFEQEEDANGWFWKDEGLYCNVMDTFEKEEDINDDAISMLKDEEYSVDFLNIGDEIDCDNVVDRLEENEHSDCWFLKNDGLDCDTDGM